MSIEGSPSAVFSRNEGTTFAFIDADNVKIQFEKALIRRKITRDELCVFDLNKLFWLANAERYYVFSATPDKGEPQDWLKKLRASDRCIFRSGRLTQNQSGRKQQGVDVMIALEASRSAFYGHLENCVLFSSDGDMLPLVDAIVNTGKAMIVVAFGDPEIGDVAPRLRDAADTYIHVGSKILMQCIIEEHRFSGHHAERLENLIPQFGNYGSLGALHDGAVLIMKNGHVNLIKAPALDESLSSVTVAHFWSLIGASAYLKLNGPLNF